VHPLTFESRLIREVQVRSGSPGSGVPKKSLTSLSSFKGFLTETALEGLLDEAVTLQNSDAARNTIASLERMIHLSDHLSALRTARLKTFLRLRKPDKKRFPAPLPALLEENMILRGYLLVNRLLENKQYAKNWQELGQILMDKHFPMENNACRELFSLSLATGNRLLKHEQKIFLHGLNELFRKGISSGVVLHKNKLPQQHFVTAIKLSVMAGEGAEALRRLESYVSLLSVKDIQLGVPGYCRSICLLEMGRFSEARKQLETFKPRGIGKIQFYVQMAKIQFELTPVGPVPVLDNFKRALSRIRNPKHAERVKDENQFISLMRRLSEAEFLSPAAAARLEKDISLFPYSREWLMKKYLQKRKSAGGTQKKRPR
jgi:hypothetical protein